MSKSFKDLNKLLDYIQKDVNKKLKKDVANVVTKEMSEVIKGERVYGAYISSADEPYQRTGELASIESMQIEIIDDDTISITNERSDGTRDVASIVATGEGYNWVNSEIFSMQPFPRNFYTFTKSDLERNGKHVQAMKDGLLKLGYRVV